MRTLRPAAVTVTREVTRKPSRNNTRNRVTTVTAWHSHVHVYARGTAHPLTYIYNGYFGYCGYGPINKGRLRNRNVTAWPVAVTSFSHSAARLQMAHLEQEGPR